MQDEPDNSSAPPAEPNSTASSTRPAPARPGLAGSSRTWLSPQQAAETVQRLRALCKTKGDQLQELETAAKALRDSGYKQELGATLREAITWPDSHPRVGALWIRRLVLSNSWDRSYPKGMDELCRRGEIGHCAVIEFLEIVSAKNRTQLVRQAVHQHAGWLAVHPVGWGVTARALARVRLYGMAAKWMADWRKRPDLDVSLLYSLALALRGVGREREAQEIVQMALSKPGAELEFPILKLWLAQEEAMAGNAEAAAAHLKDVRPSGWDEDVTGLFYLTRGLVRVMRAEPGDRQEVFKAAHDRIRDQFRKPRVYHRELMMRRQYRRSVCRMAKAAGKWSACLMARWRSADAWSTLVLLLLIPGLQPFAALFLYRFCTHRQGREK